MQVIEQFRDAIASAGMTPPDVIEADGKLRRFSSNGKRGNDSGRYVLHSDGIPAGWIGNYGTGLSQNWRADIGRTLTPAEEAEHRAKVEAMRRQREAEEARRQGEATKKAAAIWKAAIPATDDHGYLQNKGIKAHGLRVYHGDLVISGMACKGAVIVPMKIDGTIHSLQFIAPSGDRRFLSGARAAGAYYAIGTTDEIKARNAICLAEGYATAATLYESTGITSVAVFSAGNLVAVATHLRKKLPDAQIIIGGDVDASGTGQQAATDAAKSVKGLVALPPFTLEELAAAKPPSDWNDYAKLHGLDAVKAAIDEAMKVGADNAAKDTEPPPAADPNGWPEPQPLAAKVEPEPYPLDALPDTIRAAVIEVQAFTKAPVPMVAGAALAALSLAIQSYVDIKRADKLHSPVGLFLLTIADSGERKSTCDNFFTSAIRDYQAEQAELAKPEQEKHRAKLAAWEAKRTGMLDAIKQASKGSKPTANIERDLHQHEQDKPEPPRVPKLLRGDDTPENLAYILARLWPSAGAISAEGGIIFGSHGMASESAMRNMALLNILWDGGTLDIGRKKEDGSFTVRGARLTVALQVQEPTLREFFAKSGALARGTGFLARFLVALPESTQGFRPFTEAPANWPHLAEFNRRIAAILNQPAPIDESGALTPPMMTLAPDAKRAWVAFHDAIESEQASGGELYDVRDVASKSADNAARLSALFQVFERGTSAAVGLDCFEGASRIAAWHLHESRRFFGELALPTELATAARLDTWLIQYCRRTRTHLVPIAKLQQGGPNGLRSKATIELAMRELEEAGRAQWVRDGKKRQIAVNPALIEGGAS